MRSRLALLLCVAATACIEPPDAFEGEVDHSADDLPDNRGHRLGPADLASEESAARELAMQEPAMGAYAWDATDAHAARINPHRTEHRQEAITRSACLDAVARRWSRRMASGICGDDVICHRPDGGPSGIVTQVGRCWPWAAIGENVAVGGSEASLFEALLASPGHHANIDADWHAGGWGKYGVGIFRRADGRIYITQVFATRR